MPTRGRDADDMIASLMQEMGHQQGYQGGNREDNDGRELSYRMEHRQRRTSRQRQINELPNYPDNTYKAGSQSIWNPLVMGDCGSSRIMGGNADSKGLLSTTSPFLLPTNPRIELARRRVFEKFRQEVQTLLQDFQIKNLQFATSLSSGDSSSFSKNKNKLPIPSMIDKWHMDAKLEERNFFLKKASSMKNSTQNHEDEDDSHRPASLSSTADILRERAWRKQRGKPIYDPILLNKQAPPIFVETILKPHVQKMWLLQNESSTNQNSPLPPKFSKRAKQVQKGLFRLICEAIDSFENQLLQGAREESMRSTTTRKNRKGNSHNNKRPKIGMAQADGGDSASTSMVRVTFSGVTLKLHPAYLEKLQRLYDRTQDRQQRKDHEFIISSPYHHLSFEEALFCLLCRYDMIQGAGLQAGVPGSIMDVLLERFDCRMECFASPLNCRYDCFASAFADVDAPFGSKGSFFELPFLSEDRQGGPRSDGGDDDDEHGNHGGESPSKSCVGGGICYEANPPFCDGLILQLDQKITEILSAKERQTPIMFVVFVPAWRDSECYQALLTNRCLTKHILLKQGEHWYAEGTQHRRKDSFRVASFDTSILFYQNDSAKKLWNLQEEDNVVFDELRSAFGQDPGTMQKEQKILEHSSKRSKGNRVATNLSIVGAHESTVSRQSTAAIDRKKQSGATPKVIASTKPKKGAKVKKKRQLNAKEEGKAQLALLESLGLMATTTGADHTTSDSQKSIVSGKTMQKNKKRRKK